MLDVQLPKHPHPDSKKIVQSGSLDIDLNLRIIQTETITSYKIIADVSLFETVPKLRFFFFQKGRFCDQIVFFNRLLLKYATVSHSQ